ncbi:MAG TPA: NAD(P)-dependent oxidoreductase [Pirellulales bacterium]|jgi:phosphoglycerate dehydrogenase-like enzyme|nr:NAD(P)-dependent oxidoreductase [Pirellulales bacterium]
MTQTFRVALTGDFLDEAGRPAYGDLGLPLWTDAPHIRYHFLHDQAPRDDAQYWRNLYSMQVEPRHIADIDGLIVLRPWVKRQAFAEGAGRLVVIGRSGAGYDKIDVAACTANDVALFNAPHGLHHATASSALLFMLALAKRLPEQERVARLGDWRLQPRIMGSELVGRTLGIVGFGNSGRELARLVAPFEMTLLACSPHADPAQAAELGVRLVPLDDLMCEADFVSLHSRLTPECRGMIGAKQLALMKPTAFFVNVARGELVDQAALVALLGQRRIAGAALDVFEHEPLPADDPLTSLDNVILTPHWIASSTDIWRATGRAMALGILRAARGEAPDNVVNRDVLARPTFLEKLRQFAPE